MNLIQIESLAKLSADLFGVPVRSYAGGKINSCSSFVPLEADPFQLCEDQLSNTKSPVDWIITQNYYYVVLTGQDVQLVLGPVAERLSTREENALSVADALGLKDQQVPLFVSQLNSLTHMTLYKLITVIQYLGFALNGRVIPQGEMNLWKIIPGEFSFNPNPMDEDGSLKFQNDEALVDAMPIEELMESLVRHGKYQKLKHLIHTCPETHIVCEVAFDPIRRAYRNFFYAANRLQYCALQAGVSETNASTLRKYYLKKATALKDPDEICRLRSRMTIDFARRLSGKEDFLYYRKPVLEAMDYITRNIRKPISTSEIASYLFISRSRLSTIFKQDTGVNLSDYIHLRKLAMAKHMILSGSESLADIGVGLGYKSQSHFSNIFRKYVGMTPSEFRRQNTSQDGAR